MTQHSAVQAGLTVRGLSAAYGAVTAVSGIDLDLAPGRIVTVIGPNGAGKTTTLSALMGILPAQGSIRLDGEEIAGDDVEARVARGMALVPETRALFASMSVADNLLLGGFRLRQQSAAQRAQALENVYALFPRLKERLSQQAGTLSGGERQMLALGRALMGQPRVLMLDEPSLGLAPLIVRDIFDIIGRLRERGVAILLVEQNARAALALADYGYVLELGQVAHHGPAHELADDPRVIEAYLGSVGRASTGA